MVVVDEMLNCRHGAVRVISSLVDLECAYGGVVFCTLYELSVHCCERACI